jgi:PKHD-type hydroxylase
MPTGKNVRINRIFNRRGIFTAAECCNFIAWGETELSADSATRVYESDGLIRRHRQLDVKTREPLILGFEQKLRDLIRSVNEQVWHFKITKFTLSLLRYESGDESGPHVDPVGEYCDRKLAACVQLSPADAYHGGALGVGLSYEPVIREQGSLVVFPAWTPHRVMPVTSGLRHSVVCFALGPSFR